MGTSTQAIYTLFGGMAGLFEAIVADGFARFVAHIQAIARTDDAVADFFAQGAAYCDWALAHPQLYRLMFGLTGGGLRVHSGLEMTLSGPLANFPEGQATIDVMISSLQRVKEAGRIDPVETIVAARQFLSATHGYVLLHIAGAFGTDPLGQLAPLAVNLMVGLGDERAAAQDSLATVVALRADARS